MSSLRIKPTTFAWLGQAVSDICVEHVFKNTAQPNAKTLLCQPAQKKLDKIATYAYLVFSLSCVYGLWLPCLITNFLHKTYSRDKVMHQYLPLFLEIM